jgi:hypothetical protein
MSTNSTNAGFTTASRLFSLSFAFVSSFVIGNDLQKAVSDFAVSLESMVEEAREVDKLIDKAIADKEQTTAPKEKSPQLSPTAAEADSTAKDQGKRVSESKVDRVPNDAFNPPTAAARPGFGLPSGIQTRENGGSQRAALAGYSAPELPSYQPPQSASFESGPYSPNLSDAVVNAAVRKYPTPVGPFPFQSPALPNIAPLKSSANETIPEPAKAAVSSTASAKSPPVSLPTTITNSAGSENVPASTGTPTQPSVANASTAPSAPSEFPTSTQPQESAKNGNIGAVPMLVGQGIGSDTSTQELGVGPGSEPENAAAPRSTAKWSRPEHDKRSLTREQGRGLMQFVGFLSDVCESPETTLEVCQGPLTPEQKRQLAKRENDRNKTASRGPASVVEEKFRNFMRPSRAGILGLVSGL